MNKNWGILILAFSFFLLANANGSAAQSAPRTLYVQANFKGGNGLLANSPLPNINAALKIAKSGDNIKIFPGEYVENINISATDLNILGSSTADNTPEVKIISPPNSNAPLIKDNKNTVWKGIKFSAQNEALLELNNFNGRFENCAFDQSTLTSVINIYGGRPIFIACSFKDHPGPTVAINLNAYKQNKADLTFAYCIFDSLLGGVVFLKAEQGINFTNCVFSNNNYIVIRANKVSSPIFAINSVFYLMRSTSLIWQNSSAPKAILENCLYTPALGPYFGWMSTPLSNQPELNCQNCLTASPRFEKGHKVLLNFCVDDTANAPLWVKLAESAERLGLTITMALDTATLTPQYWNMIAPQINKGHEIASHGVTHSTILAKEVLRLRYYSNQNSSAAISIDENKNLQIQVDNKIVININLQDDKYKNLIKLSQYLEENGFKSELVDQSFRYIPTKLLSPVENLDIFFEANAPVLILNTDEYIKFMLVESRQAIEQGIKTYNINTTPCTAFVCPYSENNDTLLKTMLDNGIEVARSRWQTSFTSAFSKVNLYELWSASLKNLNENPPVTDKDEMMRITIDYLKYHGAAMGMYAHSESEFSISDWNTLFRLVANEPLIKSVSLTQLAKEIKQFCTKIGTGLYQCPSNTGPVAGEISYMPKPDSPLLHAGKKTAFSTNFIGQNIPQGELPNIGIY